MKKELGAELLCVVEVVQPPAAVQVAGIVALDTGSFMTVIGAK
jgi:hypothetical protein